MNVSDLQEFKDMLLGIKEELATLKEQSSRIAQTIEGDHIIPVETIDRLMTLAQQYKEKANLLQQAGAKFSISFDLTLTEMETEICAAVAQDVLATTRRIVQDYFRLTAEAEAIRCALEESKRILASKCGMPEFQTAYGFLPYQMVVNKVKSAAERLSNTEFDAIDAGISRSIARAADRNGDIVFDPAHPIDTYLDGSCELLMPITEEPPNDMAQVIDEPNMSEKDGEGDPSGDQCGTDNSGDNASSDGTADAHEFNPVPLWDSFDGYVKQYTVSKLDAGEETIRVSAFIDDATQKAEIVPAICLLGNQKLLTREELLRAGDGFFVPGEDTCTFLLDHNYITELTVSCGDDIYSFWTLTSKGWACFAKPEICEVLAKTASNMIVPKNIRISIADFTPANALRAMLIHNFFVKMEPPMNFVLSFHNREACLFGVASGETGSSISACAAVFAEGAEPNELEAMRALISNMLPEQILNIIVRSENDMHKLIEILQLDDAHKNSVTFCLGLDMTRRFDVQGFPISANSEHAKASASADTDDDLPVEMTHDAGSKTYPQRNVDTHENPIHTMPSTSDSVETEEKDPNEMQCKESSS